MDQERMPAASHACPNGCGPLSLEPGFFTAHGVEPMPPGEAGFRLTGKGLVMKAWCCPACRLRQFYADDRDDRASIVADDLERLAAEFEHRARRKMMDAPRMKGLITERREIEHAAMCEANAAWALRALVARVFPDLAPSATPAEKAPTLASLRGIARGKLKGMSSTEYVEKVRRRGW